MQQVSEIDEKYWALCNNFMLIRMSLKIAFFLVISAVATGASQAHDSPTSTLAEWAPLEPSNFAQELFEPWIPVPNGPGGAPRQGWLNTDDGFFTREVHLAYDHTDLNGGSANEALARFNYPLSRRFWIGLQVPFFEERQSKGAGSANGVGDGTLTTKVMLAETRDLSLNAGVGWQLPWGNRRTGGGQFGAEPQISVWKDVGGGVSLRGGAGYDLVDSHSQADAFVFNAAIGQTVTPHGRTPFGDLTYYLSGNLRAPDRGPVFFSLTPGMRTHLGGNLFFLAGVEVPVANRTDNFRTRVFAQFVQGF